MEWFFYGVLGIFGTIFGSFASVVIYRIKSGEKGIFTGRSHCGKCLHQLGFFDLFPIFSFLLKGGKCGYCKSKIPFVYPLLEIVMALSFMGVGIFLIDIPSLFFGTGTEWVKLIVLLVLTFCSVVYVFYDILYMEIPESILAIANITAFLYLSFLAFTTQFFSYTEMIVFTSVSAGIFAVLYTIMLQEKEEKVDIFLLVGVGVVVAVLYSFYGAGFLDFQPLEGILAAYVMFVFFYAQYFISSGGWIGGGDFRIAILMGLMLGFSHLLIGFFATYICGSIVGISILAYKSIKTKKFKHDMMIPFGPFLAFGIYFALFFGEKVKDYVNLYL